MFNSEYISPEKILFVSADHPLQSFIHSFNRYFLGAYDMWDPSQDLGLQWWAVERIWLFGAYYSLVGSQAVKIIIQNKTTKTKLTIKRDEWNHRQWVSWSGKGRPGGLAELRHRGDLLDKMVFKKVSMSRVRAQMRTVVSGFLHTMVQFISFVMSSLWNA